MRLKSFHAKTLSEAMTQVRQALGDDAIIVATREEPGGVRVTAALDDNQPQEAIINAPSFSPSALPGAEDESVVEKMTDIMLRHGVPARVSETIISAVIGQQKTGPRDALIEALTHRFQFGSLPQNKIIMLVGQPGMGKTVTTAKLAARFVMDSQKVAVFSTDVARAGGIEQLEAFTRLMKVNLMTAESGSALSDGLSLISGDQVKIIDTTGCNPYDMNEIAALGMMIKECGGLEKIEPVLVMAAGGDAVESAEIAAVFKALGARFIIPTRLDISRRLGGILAAAERANLRFAMGGVASDIADGLAPLTAEKLADLLLGTSKLEKGSKS